jgi:hypothetical protein
MEICARLLKMAGDLAARKIDFFPYPDLWGLPMAAMTLVAWLSQAQTWSHQQKMTMNWETQRP